MEQINLGYSTKNIPVPSDKAYLKNLILKVESFIKRIRWKALFYDKSKNNDDEENDLVEKFGFKSSRTPPQNESLTGVEKDLYNLVHTIKFRRSSNEFQRQLSADKRRILNSKKIVVAADKSSNMYSLPVADYKKLVMDNITTEYRKCSEIVLDDINSAAKVIAKNLKLDDRIEKFSTKNAFITMKDHKENFNNNPRCRLINPSKTEIGIISKAYLDSINTNIRKSTNLNQWKNTKEVITWFRSIENKKNSRFIQFDIINFYPSITESLLRNAFDVCDMYQQYIVH